MDNLIDKILKIIGNNKLSINFWGNEVWLSIYETEIPIVINFKEKYSYLDCETSDHHLTADMLDELYQITKLINENIDLLKMFVQKYIDKKD